MSFSANDTNESPIGSGGCCKWMRMELSGAVPWFHDGADPNGQIVDLDASFWAGEKSSRGLAALKFALAAFEIASLVEGWVSYRYAHWFMAYVSHLTVAYSCIYLLLSFMTTFQAKAPIWLVKATWIMFSVAAVQGIMVVILYWLTEYDPDKKLTYFAIMAHGITFLIVLIDGLIINRIPVRLKHCLVVMLFGALFVLWTILQSIIPVDNPWKEGTDNDALYNILDWNNSTVEAAIVSVGVIFVSFPLFTIVFWGLSLLCGRRYLPNTGKGGDGFEGTEDVEMPTFAQTY